MLLEVIDVHASYGQTQVLRGVSLSIASGQVIGLLGRNGMGKTTTIRAIMGLTPPSRGQVVLMGRDVAGFSPFRIARLGAGLVPQGRRVFGSLTAEQNIRVVAGDRGDSAVAAAYRLFPELEPLANRRAVFLSGGEQQMLAFGRALAVDPKVLLLDEPTEGLAPVVVNRLGSAIRDLAEQGQGVLLVEQNVAFAEAICDDVSLLSKGEVVHATSVEDFKRRRDLQQRFIGIS